MEKSNNTFDGSYEKNFASHRINMFDRYLEHTNKYPSPQPYSNPLRCNPNNTFTEPPPPYQNKFDLTGNRHE